MRVTQRRDFDDSDEMRTFMRRRSVFLSRRVCLCGLPGALLACVAAGGGLVQHKATEREIVQGVGGGRSGSERGWMGTGRGNRTAPDLSPGTAQPWVVITNHTSHFWGDTLPPPLVSSTGMRVVLKVRRRESGELGCSSLVRSKKPPKTTPQQLQQQVHPYLKQNEITRSDLLISSIPTTERIVMFMRISEMILGV